MADDGIIRSARFSPCRTWRYSLTREWDHQKPRLLFILLNPSTADEMQDDPTNRRGIGFAKRWGYGSVVFVNLFAFRTPHPKEMRAAADPIGPDNDRWIQFEIHGASTVVAAWGTNGVFMNRGYLIRERLGPMQCLGRTKNGHPKHPLYLANATELEPF